MAAIAGQPAPKPESLTEPVPGAEAQNKVSDFLAQFDAPEVSAETQDLPENVGSVLESAPAPVEEPGLASQALDATGRALDYAGGLTRTGLASVAGIAQDVIQGKNPLEEMPLVTEEDVIKAFKGKAPGSAEYLKRLGVPDGKSLNIGGFNVSARDAAGLVTDMATDPLTAVIKTVKKVPYLKKLINAVPENGIVNKATEALGEAVYKSALPKGAEAAGDLLLEAGAPTGGTAALAAHVENMSNALGKVRQGLYDKATQLGVFVDANKPLKNAEAVLARMKRDPGLSETAMALEELINQYKKAGKVTLDVMSEWKTNLYDSLPASAFNGVKLKNQAKMFKAALAKDFKDLIVEGGNAADKGLGDAIEAINKKWGTLLSATKPLEKAITSTGGGKIGTMIDGAVAATGGPKAYAVKKGLDWLVSPASRTYVGKALMEAGKADLASRMARQAIIKTSKGKEVPPAGDN